MRLALLAVAAASFALEGCAHGEGGPDDGIIGAFSALSSPRSNADYLAVAAASDQFEMQAAELALAQAQRPDVRAYARHLVADHAQTAQRLAEAAAEAGLPAPSPALTGAQQAMLADLQRAGAGEFDALFLEQQVPMHREAIRLHHAYALTGEAEPLRRLAASAVAKVHQHLQDARRLRRAADTQPS